MGCNVGSAKVNTKLKTQVAIRKDFEEQQELDRLQNGHDGYSGGVGSCGALRFTSYQYEHFDDGEEAVEEFIRKGEALAWQFKVIRETKPLLRAREELKVLESQAWNAPTAQEKIALRGKAAKLRVKINKIERAQAAKSTKWAWAVTTACPE